MLTQDSVKDLRWSFFAEIANGQLKALSHMFDRVLDSEKQSIDMQQIFSSIGSWEINDTTQLLLCVLTV